MVNQATRYFGFSQVENKVWCNDRADLNGVILGE